MSLPKLQTALSIALILTAGGTISLRAQTSAATDNSSISTPAIAVSTTQPKKDEAANKSIVPAESSDADKRSDMKRDAGNSNSVVGPTGSTDSMRAEPSIPSTPQGTPADEWQFQLTPYLWIASISGRAGIGNLVIDTDVSVTDSDVELNFGFMATFEARKNKFIFLTDLQYSNLSTERGNPGPLFSSTRASFKTFILDPEVGYRVLDNGKGAFVDVLGGIRYWHLNGTIDFRAGILPAAQASRSKSWVDGVAGLRGKAALSKRWFVVGKADLGAGGSDFTYQLFGGVGVNLGERIALIGGYRDLSVDYNKDGFLFDMSLHGPILGFGIKF
ncbi:MAG: hypothetical protein ND895_14340 [Pyrinomonadaceae bacterium]|nr:hypothetical protein [Pyrinomonadaceae bacterium]